MDVRILGDLAVSVAGVPVEVGAAKQRALITALALRPGAVVPAERLVDLLWGERPPQTARQTLRSLVSRSRHLLGTAVESVAGGSGYRLDLPADAVDVGRFLGRLERARQAVDAQEPSRAEQLLVEALAEWRGDPLLDLADTPEVTGERTRLHELRLSAMEQRFDLALSLGQSRELVGDLEALVAAHPVRERLWAQLMLALSRAHRQSDALRAYQRARAVLVEELGVEPGPELRALEAAVLAQSTDVPDRPPASQGHGSAWLSIDPADGVTVAALSASIGCSEGPDGPELRLDARTGAAALRCASSAEALRAARALHSDGLPSAGQLRMSVHRDGPEDDDDLAAVLLGAAHPGQVVVSPAAAADAGGLPPEMGLLDLGLHRAGPDGQQRRLHQLVADTLRGSFPPPRTLDTVPNNLVLPRTSVIGRTEDVRDVAATVRREPLLTLVGPGGVGKTRIATHVAAAVVGRFADGVWLVDLSATSAPASVPHLIAGALGVPLQAAGPPLEQLAAVLRDRHLLLVLDNCEHVLLAATAAAQVLSAAGATRVLATSREPLAGGLGRTRAVGPLSPSRAAQLFAERTPAAAAVDRSDEPVVHELCRQLDGLPLAIELAASSAVLRTPRELLELLSAQDLRGRPRLDLPARHRTLRAVAQDSYRLLDAGAQRLFARLGVFAGGADLPTIATVCGSGISAADLEEHLAGLVETSLVSAEPHGGRMRYRLLETLRRYAREWLALDPQEALATERRHGQWAADLSRRADAGLRSTEERDWHERLDLDFDEVRLACQRALAHDDVDLALRLVAPLQHYAIFRVRPELFGIAAQIADHPAAQGFWAARADALAAWGCFAGLDLTGARRHGTRALQRSDDLYTVAVTLSMLASAASMTGDRERGVALFAQALERARAEGDAYWVAFLIGFALASKATGAELAADQLVEEGAVAAAACGVRSVRAFLAVGRGYASSVRDPAAALALLRRGADLADGAGATYLAEYARAGIAPLEAPGLAGDRADGLVEQARRWWRAGDHFQAVVHLLRVSDALQGSGSTAGGRQLRAAVAGVLVDPVDRDADAVAALVDLADELVHSAHARIS